MLVDFDLGWMLMPRDHIPVAVARRVRETANHRCGYCLCPQNLFMGWLEIEHIIPVAKGGSSDESNLWLSCPLCNRMKGDQSESRDPETESVTPLFNPRVQRWKDHFCWSEDGLRIVGLSSVGRATVAALKLDSNPIALAVRKRWMQVGWHPPTD